MVGIGLCNVERRPNFLAVKAYFHHLKHPLKETNGRGRVNPFRSGDQAKPSRVSNHYDLFRASFQASVLGGRMPHVEKIAVWAFVNLKRIVSFFMDS